jgi:long-chain fatty acid transport protein
MGVNVNDIAAAAGNQPIVTTKQVFRFSPAAAFKVNDALSLGASLNIVNQSLAMSMSSPAGQVNLPQNQQFGFGATLGATYTINPKLQAGFTWVTKTDVSEMEYNTPTGTTSFDMDMPASVALGLAFKPMPGLLVEMDIKRIFFNDVMDSISVTNPPAGFPNPIRFGWDDQTVYAIGVQKEIDPKTTLRAGFNYGKSPIGAEDVKSNIGSLAVTEKHLSLGLTRQLSEKASGSLSYVRAFHNDVTSSDGTTKIELEQNIVNVQISYKF